MLGRSGAGKTSFIKRLTGEQIDKDHKITNALESELCCEINLTQCSDAWRKLLVDTGDVLRSDVTHGLESEVQKYTIETSITQTEAKDNNRQMEADNESEVLSSEPKDTNVVFEENIDDVVDKLKEFTPNLFNRPPMRHNTLINILDFGGQAVFYILHQIFLRMRCVYIVVIDMSIPLDKMMPFQLSRNTETQQMLSHLDQIVFWLNMIMSHIKPSESHSERSNVLIVGTHKDKLAYFTKSRERYATEFFEQLKSKLHGKEYRYLLRTFFAVDSLGGDETTYKQIREALLESIKVHCRWGDSQPIRWLHLQKKLREIQADDSIPQSERKMLRFDDVMKYAKECNMKTEEDLRVFLEFQHACGNLTYFSSDDLREFILPDPQWLINVFRAVITLDQFYPEKPEIAVDLLRLKDEGLVKTDGPLLPCLWKDFLSNDDEDKERIMFLLSIMSEFDLAIQHTDTCYLIPCMLPVSNQDAALPTEQRVTKSPIYLQFHSSKDSFDDFFHGNKTYDHFLPHGIFHRLVCRLARLEGWKWEQKYNDRVSYVVGDFTVEVSTRSTWIRVDAFTPDVTLEAPVSQYLTSIRGEIDNLLEVRIAVFAQTKPKDLTI